MPGQEVILLLLGRNRSAGGWIRLRRDGRLLILEISGDVHVARLAGERQGADQAVVAVEVAAAHAEPEDVAGLHVERGRAGVVKAAGRGCAAVDRAGALELL